MRLDNPSDLGPWNRYQDSHEHHQSIDANNNLISHRKLRQQIMFPPVANRKKNLVIGLKQTKQKTFHPMKHKYLHIQIKDKLKQNLNQNQQNTGSTYRTVSFDPPMISFYNKKHPKLNKGKNKYWHQHSQLQQYKHTLNRQHGMISKMSKIDLLADYENQQNDIKKQQKQKKQYMSKQHQFTKKRSLMQLMRYLKNTPSMLTSRNKLEQKQDLSFRYQSYRNRLNISLQAQPKYLPYFQSRKSHYSILKK